MLKFTYIEKTSRKLGRGARLLALTLLIGLTVGCRKDSGFSFVDDSASTSQNGLVEIIDHTPNDEPVIIMNSGTTTFAVTVGATAGDNVTYIFELDGNEISSGFSPYFVLSNLSISAGAHTMEVTATNGSYTDSHTFQLKKNTPPAFTLTAPPATANSVSCGGGTLTFAATAADSDSDTLSFTWKVNGVSQESVFNVTNSESSSQAVFAPGCALAGAANVTLDVNDGYDLTSHTWAVTIANPTVATIEAYSPTVNPVVIPSSGNQVFSISASGKSPLSYSWRIRSSAAAPPGVVIPGATSAIYTLNAAAMTAGDYILTAEAVDEDSSDSHDFNVRVNAAPVLSHQSPGDDLVKSNFRNLIAFSIEGLDPNNDLISYVWTLDGVAEHSAINASSTGGGSQAVLTASESLVGEHIIKVTASDGVESSTQTWTVEVNYFSDECNQAIGAGRVCTLVGYPGLGDGFYPGDIDDIPKIRVQPSYVLDDGAGNLFISDEMNHVVWFYNRSASSVVRLGKTVQPGQIVVVSGNGASGVTADGSSGTAFKLNSPSGMVWLQDAGALLIADRGNDRVVYISSTGTGTTVFGGGGNNAAGNVDGGSAVGHYCNDPVDMAIDSNGGRIYVSCYSSHSIKSINISNPDPSNWEASLLVGRLNGSGAAQSGSSDGGIGASGAQLNGPWSLAIDSTGKQIFFAEYGSCALRVVNISGTPKTFFGSFSVNHNSVKTFFSNGCNTTVTGPVASMRLNRPRGLAVREVGGVLHGLFVTSTNNHHVLFINNTNAPMTFGNQSVPAYQGLRVVNDSNTSNYNGDGSYGANTYLASPWGVSFDSTNTYLMIADYANARIRRMPLNSTTGIVSTDLGRYHKYGYLGESIRAASDVMMNAPTHLMIDSTNPGNELLLYSDTGNFRIRQVNLKTGYVQTAIGNGNGAGNIENELPLDVLTRGLRGLAMLGAHLVYSDQQSGTGTGRNCQVRLWNRGNSHTSFFGKVIEAGRIGTIVGDYNLGCAAWDSSYEGGSGTAASLHHPEGVALDGDTMYIANYSSSCILKLTSDGKISTYIGSCGSAGNSDGALSGSSVRLRNPVTVVVDPRYPGTGNMFISDQATQSISAIKYANFTDSEIMISDQTVASGQILTIAATSGFFRGIAVYDRQICYSSGDPANGFQGSHNVVCKDRDDPSGSYTIRVGPADNSAVRGGSSMHKEHEGVLASQVKLNGPYGLAFDSAGNLYIGENNGHTIRRVNKWW